ncbi:MAG: hypothetical protein HY808_10450 [Nitrospirae bacterium]|nr:hypothetical protein [Nitrospirota bacterium]
MDPRVPDDKVPAYDIIEAKIRQIDNTVILFRVFYLLDTLIYRVQLIKKDTMCIVELSKKLLLDLKNGSPAAERELTDILQESLDSADCWRKLEG